MDHSPKNKQATDTAQESEPDYRGIAGKASLNAGKENIHLGSAQIEEDKPDEESPLSRGI